MTPPPSTYLSGPTRCVIYCSRTEYDKHSKGAHGESLVQRVVRHALGDIQKASLLGTVLGTHAFIVFDYDNPDHLDSCEVLGFRARKSIRRIYIPAKMVHSTVIRWKAENENHGSSFPHQEQVCPNIDTLQQTSLEPFADLCQHQAYAIKKPFRLLFSPWNLYQ